LNKFLATLALATIASLGYVSQEVEAVKIGYTIRKQEETKTLLLDRARALKYNIARLKAPNTLEKRLTAQKISLQSPKSWQTLVVSKGQEGQRQTAARPFLVQPPILSKLFVGTAQAEAKES
jgi:hypothetical protein